MASTPSAVRALTGRSELSRQIGLSALCMTNLAAKLAAVNAEKNLAGTTPAEAQVSDWIGQANALEPRISH